MPVRETTPAGTGSAPNTGVEVVGVERDTPWEAPALPPKPTAMQRVLPAHANPVSPAASLSRQTDQRCVVASRTEISASGAPAGVEALEGSCPSTTHWSSPKPGHDAGPSTAVVEGEWR